MRRHGRRGDRLLLFLLLLLPLAAVVRALKMRAAVQQGSQQFAAVVMNPTGLAAGATVSWTYAYTAAGGNSSSSSTTTTTTTSAATVLDGLDVPALPPLLVMVDGEQLARYYPRAAQNDGTHFEDTCLAPAALRLEVEPTPAPQSGSFVVAYTAQYALLLLQCAPRFAGVLDLTVEATTLNPDAEGRLVHHLGLETLLLPRVFGALLVAALLLLVVWVVDIACLTRQHASALHVGLALGLAVRESCERRKGEGRRGSHTAPDNIFHPNPHQSINHTTGEGGGAGLAGGLLRSARPRGPGLPRHAHLQ